MQEEGRIALVYPRDAIRESLPDVFPFDNKNGWLSAIGFADTQRKSTEEYQKEESILKIWELPA